MASNAESNIINNQEQPTGGWRTWLPYRATAATSTSQEEQSAANVDETTPEEIMDQQRWYSNVWNKISEYRTGPTDRERLMINSNARYSQLNVQQISYLETESIKCIKQRSHTWCWYENLTGLNVKDLASWTERNGVVSVFGTGSGKCPLPLNKYPMETHPGYHVYIKNSTILPADSPLEIYHNMPFKTKIATAVKDYYNFSRENHLYLKKDTVSPLKERKILIISIVGWLPEKYERSSIGEQRTAQYLCKKLAQSLQFEAPSEIKSLSFECPLDSSDTMTVLNECLELISHWNDHFNEVDNVFFIGVYHSVPLMILLARNILERATEFKIKKNTNIGLLAIESCLGGYRFWDHSTDFTTSTEEDNKKIQQNREKQLFQGLSKNEQEVLSKIKSYKEIGSAESKLIQGNLNWLLLNWDSLRLTLFGKLYDNFMTITQKLAIDYKHPKIIRNIWCNGKYLSIDTRRPNDLGIQDIHMKSPNFEAEIKIPKERNFEVTLMNNLILTQNLGKEEFIPVLKLLSPFFISRSFNENTISPSMRKQKQNDLKTWLQEMDDKWGTVTVTDNYNDELPENLASVYKFLEYSHYESLKYPDLIQIYDDIYDDDSMYRTFIQNTTLTKKPLTIQALKVLPNTSSPSSILSTVNQYDLVWKFHEALSKFIQLRNLPEQEGINTVDFSITLDTTCWKQIFSDDSKFNKDNTEAIARVIQIWEKYQDWSPPTRGLKQLKNILSVLSLYNTPSKLVKDIQRK
ncbi:hypothetical protein NCAS_0D00970 [Naumovozyma castellii]|uniref:Uncharacterized protein n=1 Tax=Naumovozyma castellii TaxID=27288 RepID=G0VDP0_NAUCA|nr:hypothetical protein NCAS_0D00970 [Naumovozyma castellii CBS 4309]CCC69678.1 hypothetical protein NCAS_0D00970 [Naumovozyma castellii CBS 4309]